MNRYKKERLKKYTPEQIKQQDADSSQQQWEDAHNFPELYIFISDSSWDIRDREKGISPLNKETRDYIRMRYERGDYPERLHSFVFAELNLKGAEEL